MKIRGINPYVLVSAVRARKIKPQWRRPLPVLVRINGHPKKTPWRINMMPVGDGSFYLYLHESVRHASETDAEQEERDRSLSHSVEVGRSARAKYRPRASCAVGVEGALYGAVLVAALFRSKGFQGINTLRANRGHETRDYCNTEQHKRDAAEHERIVRRRII